MKEHASTPGKAIPDNLNRYFDSTLPHHLGRDAVGRLQGFFGALPPDIFSRVLCQYGLNRCGLIPWMTVLRALHEANLLLPPESAVLARWSREKAVIEDDEQVARSVHVPCSFNSLSRFCRACLLRWKSVV